MKCRRNACIANGAHREGEAVLLAMARARMISPQTVQKLSSLLYSLPLHSSLKSDYCLLISLDPAAHLHMELHYSCGAWHPIPPREPPAAAGRPEHVIVERVHCAQRESCHYGRLIDRVKANENTWNPI